VNTIGQRIKEARQALGLNQNELARRAGLRSGSAITMYESGARSNPKHLLALASALQVNPQWLQYGRGPRSASDIPKVMETPGRWVAQALSLPESMLNPVPLHWDQLGMKSLPQLFVVELLDDSMAPEYRRGSKVIFSTDQGEPRAQDAVLVRNEQGEMFFREFRAKSANSWLCHALAAGYEPLSSERDQLTVVAIAVGVWGRRG
jgi:transcriptional regulator with XRE-family HTH domain